MCDKFKKLNKTILKCKKCPRLVNFIKKISKEKRKQNINEKYWGKPVTGFGDINAKILILGLAPAAHGGTRTGRAFTGDKSGEFLFKSLHLAKIGSNFLGILNDIKRRPEDAARELQIPIEQIQSIIQGKLAPSSEIIERASSVWPVNEKDFYVPKDDCSTGIKIFRVDESKKSARIMTLICHLLIICQNIALQSHLICFN